MQDKSACRITSWTLHLRRGNYSIIVFSPGLKVLVECRVNPVLVFRDSNLAVVRSDSCRDTAEVVQCVIVDSEPVLYLAFCHSLGIEVFTVGQGCNEDSHLGRVLRGRTVMDNERLPGVIKLKVDARLVWDMDGYLLECQPFRVTPAVLAITQRSQ